MSAGFRLDPFVSIPLLSTATEYATWSSQIRFFLESRGLWSVIEDTSCPDDKILFRCPDVDVEQYNARTRQRQLVGTYLKNKLSPPMRRVVEHTTDGNEIWSLILRHCQPEKPDFAFKLGLGARLSACKGEEFSSTHDYAQAYGKLLDAMDAAGISLEENRVIGFLLGLKDVLPNWVALQVERISKSGRLPTLSDLAFEARIWEDMEDTSAKVRRVARSCVPTTLLERARQNPKKLALKEKNMQREFAAMDMT